MLLRAGWIVSTLLAGALLPLQSAAQTSEEEQWNARFQATYVWQRKGAFDAPYTGANSLRPAPEKKLR